MKFEYELDPLAIERKSFQRIRQSTNLEPFSLDEQQVVMRIVHSMGLPDVAQHVRFSANACHTIRTALVNKANILCDVEMVKQGLTKRMLSKEPLCYLNHQETAQLAKSKGETRSMAALALWEPHLANSIVVIGNAPTALFRLLEMLSQGAPKPAAIIGMPVGFVGAAESKQALWDNHQELGIECITLLTQMGGSAVTAASCNALMRCNLDEYY